MPKRRKKVMVDQDNKGLKCPKCHSPDIRVDYGRDGPHSYRRVRVCRDCGHEFQTIEQVIGARPEK